jgi:hypothetical protein
VRQWRLYIGQRDGCQCRYCGVLLPIGGGHLEHVFPVCQRGFWEDFNYVLACGKCNASKGPHDPFQWYIRVRNRGNLARYPKLASLLVELAALYEVRLFNPRAVTDKELYAVRRLIWDEMLVESTNRDWERELEAAGVYD